MYQQPNEYLQRKLAERVAEYRKRKTDPVKAKRIARAIEIHKDELLLSSSK